MRIGRHERMCGWQDDMGCGDTQDHGMLDVPIGAKVVVRQATASGGFTIIEFRVTTKGKDNGVAAWVVTS